MIKGLCVAAVAMMVGTAAAQVDSPASRLQAASALTSIDAIDQPAWHLKLDVTLFDVKGKNPSQGTVEVWHRGRDERRVYVFWGASTTTLNHDGKIYYEKDRVEPPYEAEEVLQQVLHPGPEPREIEGAVPEARKKKFGNVELACLMLTQRIQGAGEIPLGLFPTYCVDGTGVIRFSYNFGGQAVFLNGIGTFVGHDVSTAVTIREHEAEVAFAKVATLTTYAPQADEFTPGPSMAEAGATARISGGVIAGNRVSFVEPVYPTSAKQYHETGTVVLHAIIGRDGHVHSLRPMSVPANADFVVSAIIAVRQWTYRPYLLNGVPTEVDTTITVNYALNPF